MLILKELREAFVVENRGEKIFGVLHLPEGKENCPIVVVMHGYASTKVGTNRSHVKLAMKLVEEEIGCCRFDFRGAGDSEGDLSSLTMEDLYDDACVVLEHLRERGFEKIGIFGSSLGGSIAVMTAARQKIDAVALWAPVASGVLWFQDWMDRQKGSLDTYQGVGISERFRSEFANFRVDQLLDLMGNVPLLHMHGDQDEIVTVRHAKVFENARKDIYAYTKFVQYHDAEHQLGRSKVFAEATSEICHFFKTFLL